MANQRYPENKEIAMYLCKAYYKQKNYDACIKLTQKLIARYPNEIRLKFNLAQSLYQRANMIFNLKARKVV